MICFNKTADFKNDNFEKFSLAYEKGKRKNQGHGQACGEVFIPQGSSDAAIKEISKDRHEERRRDGGSIARGCVSLQARHNDRSEDEAGSNDDDDEGIPEQARYSDNENEGTEPASGDGESSGDGDSEDGE
mmetsp:Transcript_36197/g.71705  ORF Transcript_36197/g.71705 Transcript_36197/m.71705 type:complete len:131 (-) Transcript_36197:206-598(-)